MSNAELLVPDAPEITLDNLGEYLLLGYAAFTRDYDIDMNRAIELRWAGTRLYDKAYAALLEQQESHDALPYDFPGEHDSFMDPATRAVALRGLAEHIEFNRKDKQDFRPEVNLVNRLVTVTKIEGRSGFIMPDDGISHRMKKSIRGTIERAYFGTFGNQGVGELAINAGKVFRNVWQVDHLIDKSDYSANVTIQFED